MPINYQSFCLYGQTTIKYIYDTSFVYCRELAPGTVKHTVSLTGDWVRGDDSKQYR